ncbi:MAG: IclR family transcriptional regulator [Deltaproteobacteria bacterium]|nr:IclR family transcriptional regulator [Deltaproteobacteria bacterium]
MKRSKDDYVIRAVENAMCVLEAFQEDEILGVTELAKRLGLHKNKVFRLLATLEQKGYVEQCEDERYRLGSACLALARAFERHNTLAKEGQRALEGLCAKTSESAHLAVLDGFSVMHIGSVICDCLLSTGSRTGSRLSAHNTALGKALLAFLPSERLDRLDRKFIRKKALAAATPASITDRDKFFDHLRAVAGQGFALDIEECAVGLCCVAAPVHGADGAVIAALSISVPTARAGEEALRSRFAPEVVAAAAGLSRRLCGPA